METNDVRGDAAAENARPPEHAEFMCLVRQYRRLALPSTAVQQRERERLNGELMRLFLKLHPHAPYRPWDDSTRSCAAGAPPLPDRGT